MSGPAKVSLAPNGRAARRRSDAAEAETEAEAELISEPSGLAPFLTNNAAPGRDVALWPENVSKLGSRWLASSGILSATAAGGRRAVGWALPRRPRGASRCKVARGASGQRSAADYCHIWQKRDWLSAVGWPDPAEVPPWRTTLSGPAAAASGVSQQDGQGGSETRPRLLPAGSLGRTREGEKLCFPAAASGVIRQDRGGMELGGSAAAS